MPPKNKGANGYKLPDPLPKGEILEDKSKKKWKLGSSIGKGGFGEIYAAQALDVGGAKFPYVIKIEPHSNGPLFVELHFYVRNGKENEITAFMKQKGLKTFGMPKYIGSGSHEHKGEKYRFIVMEKFGTDVWKLYNENDKKFPATTVFQLGIQMLDVLEYIHSKGYVHADIKGANILMGITKETENKQAYLVDFGLATKFTSDTEFKPNPKKAHDGTIEYLSRDAHKGVQTVRGDLEILVYNLIQWLGCKLPWEKNLKDPKIVQNSKEMYMQSIQKFAKECFGSSTPPAAIIEYLTCLQDLDFNTVPDYAKFHKILEKGLKDAGGSLNSNLVFMNTAASGKKAQAKRKSNTVGASPRRKLAKNGFADDNEDGDSDVEVKAKNQELNGKHEGRARSRKSAASESEEEMVKPTATKGKGRSRKSVGTESEGEMVQPSPGRGRPKKNVSTESEEEMVQPSPSKGRGRPKKSVGTESEGEMIEPSPAKGRGRPKKSTADNDESEEEMVQKSSAKGRGRPKNTAGATKKVKPTPELDTSIESRRRASKFKIDYTEEDSEDEIESYVRKPGGTSRTKGSGPERRGRPRKERTEEDESEETVATPKSKGSGKRGRPKKQTSEESETENKDPNDNVDSMEGYTDAMKEVVKKKQENGKKKRRPTVERTENEEEKRLNKKIKTKKDNASTSQGKAKSPSPSTHNEVVENNSDSEDLGED